MKFTTTAQLAKTGGLKILVYGPAGVGKTHLCGTTGDPARTLFVCAEGGVLTLRGLEMPAKSIRTIAELRELYVFLRSGQHNFTWVCVDSISDIAETCLAEAMKPAPGQKVDGRTAYGEMANTMLGLIKAFRDLMGINVLMIAKQDRNKDDVGRLLYGPSMPGNKLTQGIGYLFDEVFALRTNSETDADTGKTTVHRALQTVNDGQYEAKDRSGVLSPYEAPSLEHIEAKIHGREVPAGNSASNDASNTEEAA